VGKHKDEKTKLEYGDFQTPDRLAADVCQVLAALRLDPRAIVEPTCGVGSLVLAALDAFPDAERAWAIDVNAAYVDTVRDRALARTDGDRLSAERGNFFDTDWPSRIAELPEPILFVGNPPWVTSADLGYLKSHNIPEKANFHGRAGIDAVTGKSNFDISEWMLLKLLSWLNGRDATLAMLCKTSVARKALAYGWNAGFGIVSAAIYRIDSAKHFGAAVDACLLVCQLGSGPVTRTCAVFDGLAASTPLGSFGDRDGILVADTTLYDRHRRLIGSSQYQWRSGVKHDCSSVMELRVIASGFANGDGEAVDIEDTFLFPMMKSSDVARDGAAAPKRWMIVTQKRVSDDTASIRTSAPRTWEYLTRHRARFDNRGSSIYRGKPPFSIFGVGEYTFAPWKVAISGLYKKLEFKVIGPHGGKPVVLDDTCYFAACRSESEARFVAQLLASRTAREFFGAFVFWDAKRPITTDLLRRLDLRRLAEEVGRLAEYDELCRADPTPQDRQVSLDLPGM
jgi:hypothetical protein